MFSRKNEFEKKINEIWKGEYQKLKEVNKILENSQSNRGSSAGEMIDNSSGIESKRNEINDLGNEIIAKEKAIKNAPKDSSLLEQLEKLKSQLLQKENELEELKKTNKALEKQLGADYQKLKDKIAEKRKELE